MGDDRTPETTVAVAPGEASIQVRAQDEEMNGIRGVYLLMRYNGHIVPSEVLRDMAWHQGRSLITGAAGTLVLEQMPLGIYEFWPYFRSGQAGVRGGTPTGEAPVRIAVQPGANSVTLTFARR